MNADMLLKLLERSDYNAEEPPVIVLDKAWWGYADLHSLWDSKWPRYVKARRLETHDV